MLDFVGSYFIRYLGTSYFLSMLVGCLNSMATITLCAYPLTKTRWFQRLMVRDSSIWERLQLGLVFGLLSVLGVAIGQRSINDAIVDNGIVGVVAGGLTGGLASGLCAGLMGGLCRLYLGGFAAEGDALAILLCGLISGLIGSFRKKRIGNWAAFLIGFLLAVLHMMVILAVSRPLILAKTFLSLTAVASVAGDSLGVFLLLAFLRDVEKARDLAGAAATEKAMQIAEKTLPILRRSETLAGLPAEAIAGIVYEAAGVDTVAFSNEERILAFYGAGADHHLPGDRRPGFPSPWTAAGGDPVLHSGEEIGCKRPGCPLNWGATVALPSLPSQEEQRLYISFFNRSRAITLADCRMLSGLSTLLTQQISIARSEYQKKLLAAAEYNTLKSQINPHFLFNALSAIKSLIRTDPDKAQSLILDLSGFIRSNISRTSDLIVLEDELRVTELYLQIQSARFGDRLHVEIAVPFDCRRALFPSFCLQPLVENCMNHGLRRKEGAMRIAIHARREGDALVVSVTDNGVGFPDSVLDKVRRDSPDQSMGIGLTNISRRLRSLYPGSHRFRLENIPAGSRVTVQVPYNLEEGGPSHADSHRG